MSTLLTTAPEGFETVDDFLSYCSAHSATPRALFNTAHINWLLEAAGSDHRATADFMSIHEREMIGLVAEISRRIRLASKGGTYADNVLEFRSKKK